MREESTIAKVAKGLILGVIFYWIGANFGGLIGAFFSFDTDFMIFNTPTKTAAIIGWHIGGILGGLFGFFSGYFFNGSFGALLAGLIIGMPLGYIFGGLLFGESAASTGSIIGFYLVSQAVDSNKNNSNQNDNTPNPPHPPPQSFP